MSEIDAPAPRAPGTGEPRLQVALLWGLTHIDVLQTPRKQEVAVGNDASCPLQVFAPELGERFPLVRWIGNEAILSAPSSALLMRGHQDAELEPIERGELSPDPELAGVVRLRLTGDDRVLVSFGLVRLLVSWERAERTGRAAPALDPVFARAVTMSAMLSCAAVIAGSQADLEVEAPVDFVRVSQPWVKVAVKPPPPAPKPAAPKLKLEPSPGPKQPAGATASDRRGGRNRSRPGGLLALLDEGGGSAAVFSNGPPRGLEALDNLRAPGSAAAGPGFGERRGPGGPGTMRLGGIGIGIGGPGGPGGGGFGPLIGGSRRGPVEVAAQPQPLAGACEKSVIAKTVQRHANAIRTCYETALSKNPSLEGKLSVEFTIDPAGAVGDARISESTLAAPEVDTCVLQRVARWRFPEPKDGGVCVIRYPWVFKVSGE